jgi:glycerol kinase
MDCNGVMQHGPPKSASAQAGRDLPCGAPDTFAIIALRRKRAHLAGEIAQAAKALAKQRETLATLDAVINLFEAASNAELIPRIRAVSRRCVFFRHEELARPCLSALREASKPVPCQYVAGYAIQAKGLDVDRKTRELIAERIRLTLSRLSAKGLARKIMEWPETW